MATAIKFDKSKASRIAQAIADCADRRALVLTMRERLLGEFKGLPRKPLGETEAALVRDALQANIEARDTVSESSVGPMVSTAAKIATYMPCILGLEAAKFAVVSESYGTLAKFATAVKDAEGDVNAAIAEFSKGKKTNYKKSAAAHLKALVGLKNGKFLNAAQKALAVALADSLGIDFGEVSTDHRNPKVAAALATKGKQ